MGLLHRLGAGRVLALGTSTVAVVTLGAVAVVNVDEHPAGTARPASAIVAASPSERVDAEPREADEYDGLPIDEYAFAREPWARRMFGELEQVPYRADPFLGIRLGDFRGEHINIVNAKRVSWTPEDPELTVWFFGGSTMFGIGQRDDHTIPSVVARAAAEEGIDLQVVNFGISGFVSWQGVERLGQELTAEEEPPDLVVFYDGANERALASMRIEAGDQRVDGITRMPLSEEEHDKWYSAHGSPTPLPWGDGERIELELAAASQQYRRGAEIARALGQSYGFSVAFVWQPHATAKRVHPTDAELHRRLSFDPAQMDNSTAYYRSILVDSGVEAVDMIDVFDDLDTPVYFDWGHTNELGARIVGEAMFTHLRSQLLELVNER